LLSEAKSLKTNSRDYQAQVHSDQMVLEIARQEGGPCERRLNSRATSLVDTHVRLGTLGSQKT
jgi:hypothetical protein